MRRCVIGMRRRMGSISNCSVSCGRLTTFRDQYSRMHWKIEMNGEISSSSVSSGMPVSNRAPISTGVEDMLIYLNGGRPKISISEIDLMNAPETCVHADRTRQLLPVIDIWYHRVKPIMEKMGYFNVANIIRRLGNMNRIMNGAVLHNFGSYSPMSYFMRRMIEMGFDKFQAQDIIRALSGIYNFTMFRPRNFYIGEQQFGSILEEWLMAFDHRINCVTPRDQDYHEWINRAPSALLYLSRLNVKNPRRTLFQRLCQWSKTNFDRRLGYGGRQRDELDSKGHLQWVYYADALYFVSIDPESLVMGSWSSWFDLCKAAIRKELDAAGYDQNGLIEYRPGFNYASKAIMVTEKFASTNSGYFWIIFDDWRDCVEKSLADIAGRPCLNDRKYIPKFVFNLGNMVKRLEAIEDHRRLKLRFVVPLLDKAVINFGAGFDIRSQFRILTGLRNIFEGLNLIRQHRFSDQFYAMLRDWCLELRMDERNLTKSSEAAAGALRILYELHRQQTKLPPRFLIQELCSLYLWGLDFVNDVDLGRALANFGDACVNFNFDPTKLEDGENSQFDGFWQKYFEKTRMYLVNRWPLMSQQENKMHGSYVISILLNVTVLFKRTDDFRYLKEIVQKRLKEISPFISQRQAATISNCLQDWCKDTQEEIDKTLMKELGRKVNENGENT